MNNNCLLLTQSLLGPQSLLPTQSLLRPQSLLGPQSLLRPQSPLPTHFFIRSRRRPTFPVVVEPVIDRPYFLTLVMMWFWFRHSLRFSVRARLVNDGPLMCHPVTSAYVTIALNFDLCESIFPFVGFQLSSFFLC